jgi:hypothetical protein
MVEVGVGVGDGDVVGAGAGGWNGVCARVLPKVDVQFVLSRLKRRG